MDNFSVSSLDKFFKESSFCSLFLSSLNKELKSLENKKFIIFNYK